MKKTKDLVFYLNRYKEKVRDEGIGPIINDPYFIDLVNCIRSNKKYSTFDNETHWFGFFGKGSSYEGLAEWLTIRSFEVGVEGAIKNVDEYLVKNSIEMTAIAVCENHIEESFEFSNGVKAESELVDLSIPHSIHSPINYPHLILSIDYNQPLTKGDEAPYHQLTNVINCLSLTTPIDIGINNVLTGKFIKNKSELPFNNVQSGGWTLPSENRSYLQPSLIPPFLNEANSLLKSYQMLNQHHIESLSVAIKRLNKYCYSFNSVEKAIDLRICIEAIFLANDNNDHSQLRYRLALRGAKYIGNNMVERKEIFKKFRDAYDLTSAVVHRGKVSDKHDQKLLDEIAGFAKQTLIKEINSGSPINWLEVELS